MEPFVNKFMRMGLKEFEEKQKNWIPYIFSVNSGFRDDILKNEIL